jgi:hypothetical protein
MAMAHGCWIVSGREGRALGCRKLVLDTALENTLAHRFYYRQGLLAMSLRFNCLLD